MIPTDTVRVVDTVWVAAQSQRVGFVEIATAWSTVAVALFALVTLFLPLWDRRRQRATVDARVAAAAHTIGGLVAGLEDEVLIRSRAESFEWANALARDAAACRDRIMELALQARDGSPAKAAATTSALVTITQIAYGFEMLARLKDGPISLYHQTLTAQSVLGGAMVELPECRRALEAAENSETLAIWHQAAAASKAAADKARAEKVSPGKAATAAGPPASDPT